ncbi:hypothetical protein [Novilysobacter erysipheiresistens]|uniref:Lipoprotein n=1 Tax=Novilysobacter erysipheiresistens TaxID=1749332 RepID=A0ABU7Z0U8_9GAMM
MKTMIMMAGMLVAVAGCATTDPGDQAAAPAAVAPTSASTPAVASDATAAKNTGDVRCKHMPVLGSRVGQKVCRTEEEWAALEKQAKEIMSDLEANPLGRQEGG